MRAVNWELLFFEENFEYVLSNERGAQEYVGAQFSAVKNGVILFVAQIWRNIPIFPKR